MKLSLTKSPYLDFGIDQQMTAAGHSFLLLTYSLMFHERFEELVRQLTAVSFFALLLLWFSLLSSRSTVLSDNILPTCPLGAPLIQILFAARCLAALRITNKHQGTWYERKSIHNLCTPVGVSSPPPPSAASSDPEFLDLSDSETMCTHVLPSHPSNCVPPAPQPACSLRRVFDH